jgi:hypothetical protein
MTAAVAYFRISSVTNVGEDKDSRPGSGWPVEGYAARHGLEIIHESYNAAVKSGDRVDLRPGFAEMIAYMSSNGAVPSWSRARRGSSRDLIAQETGYRLPQEAGLRADLGGRSRRLHQRHAHGGADPADTTGRCGSSRRRRWSPSWLAQGCANARRTDAARGEGNRADVRSWELPTAAVVVMVRRFWRSADASC